MAFLYIVFVVSLINSVYGAQTRVDPLVLIDQGLVRGLKSSDGSYSKFLGIPYGEVDLNNPFGEARPHPGFGNEVYKAYDGTKICPQSIKSSDFLRAADGADETLDCLRLNVYAPTIASSQNPLPVFIWIHGGGYAIGSAGKYDPENLVKQGIVIVTINYRLGPYGFLCLDVPDVPGNTGLKDQYLALRWVRNHIRAFGGNPYNVTIGGHSAGAESVLHHLYSKKEKLYSKVVLQSGTHLKPVSFTADAEAAVKISSYLGFNTTDTVKSLEFLTKSSHVLVARAAADLNLEFRPCTEKNFDGVERFLDTNPFSLSNTKKVKNTPILIGQTSMEHYGSQAKKGDDYYKTDPFLDTLRDNFNMDEVELAKAARTVRHFYIGDEVISRDIASDLETFTTDFLYNHPFERTVVNLLNEKASNVYEYEFRYLGGNQDSKAAPHSEELKYLFNFHDVVVEENEENQLLIRRFTKLWANFIKYGNPTPTVSELLPIKWTPVSIESRPYMIIDSELKIEHRVNKERMAFWDLFYKAYGQYFKYAS